MNDIVDLFDSTCDPLIMGECKVNVYYMKMIIAYPAFRIRKWFAEML